ncbi:protein root UVB sensitive 5 isoform X2 [Momordica charantia]|uniref:Protein root UVB sensitive 5 isoform X2 n=1 Tax=Momordica charantia TaxID=3673 RepID=A0A6J1DDX2_MOMCH|nr:protein root UVB sensitive 5 isoform X2 [Momordica charantia]XP_022151587.1 protein root UVB sensitive 5 isoform X2 [Momordica charantia]
MYILDDNQQLQYFIDDQISPASNGFEGSHFSETKLSWLTDLIKDFILPAGFPESVSDDYLQYMILQFPTNITGWICHTLVTSSLLKAVGIGSFSGTTAAASAAAIRWVSKDGIGAVGRLFIGGRFGNLFDDDPKQWRMYADFIGSAGSIFDLATPLYPNYFLPLASLGNLAKAVARGLKDPSFRVIQYHFAVSGNLGEIAAKEEVWEVVAQLLGLALGILILDTPGLVNSYPVLSMTWFSMRLLHLWLRYQSLAVLHFNTINLKRARILVRAHIVHNKVPGTVDCNTEENILLWEKFTRPAIIFGVSLEEMMGGERSSSTVMELLKLYAKEKYILMLNTQDKDLKVSVSFKVGATSMSVLRSIWQTYWLDEHWHASASIMAQLARSLSEMEDKFNEFMQLLEGAGWNTHQLSLKVPNNVLIDVS